MPPWSYLISAVALGILVAVSIPPTLGFSIILWYWLFSAAACLLAIVGVFRIVAALGAPLWVAIALASPEAVWAADHLKDMTDYMPSSTIFLAFRVAAYLAFLGAAAGALRLVETISKTHVVLRLGYGVLAVAAVVVGFSFLARGRGWGFTTGEVYPTFVQAVAVAAVLVSYGSLIGAAALIVLRRGVERWTGVVIALIGAYRIYASLAPLFVPHQFGHEDPMLFLMPVVMLVGGAAVWRIGSVLSAQERPGRLAQDYSGANAGREPFLPN